MCCPTCGPYNKAPFKIWTQTCRTSGMPTACLCEGRNKSLTILKPRSLSMCKGLSCQDSPVKQQGMISAKQHFDQRKHGSTLHNVWDFGDAWQHDVCHTFAVHAGVVLEAKALAVHSYSNSIFLAIMLNPFQIAILKCGHPPVLLLNQKRIICFRTGRWHWLDRDEVVASSKLLHLKLLPSIGAPDLIVEAGKISLPQDATSRAPVCITCLAFWCWGKSGGWYQKGEPSNDYQESASSKVLASMWSCTEFKREIAKWDHLWQDWWGKAHLNRFDHMGEPYIGSSTKGAQQTSLLALSRSNWDEAAHGARGKLVELIDGDARHSCQAPWGYSYFKRPRLSPMLCDMDKVVDDPFKHGNGW